MQIGRWAYEVGEVMPQLTLYLTHADRASWAFELPDIPELIFEISLFQFKKLYVW